MKAATKNTAMTIIIAVIIPFSIIIYSSISYIINRMNFYGEYQVETTETPQDYLYDKILFNKDMFCITYNNALTPFSYTLYGSSMGVYQNTNPQQQTTPSNITELYPNAKTYTIHGNNPVNNSPMNFTLIRDGNTYYLYDGYFTFKLIRTTYSPFSRETPSNTERAIYGKYKSVRTLTATQHDDKSSTIGFNVQMSLGYIAVEYPWGAQHLGENRTDFVYNLIQSPSYEQIPMTIDRLSYGIYDVTPLNIPFYLGTYGTNHPDEPLDENRSYIIQPVDGSNSNTNDFYIYVINDRVFIKLPMHYEAGFLQVELEKI